MAFGRLASTAGRFDRNIRDAKPTLQWALPYRHVLDVLERDNLAERASQSGALLKDLLADALSGKPGVKEVRGVGLLLAIELDNPCGELVMRAADKGLLINVTADTVIRLLPPLVASDSEIREMAARLIPLVEEFLNA